MRAIVVAAGLVALPAAPGGAEIVPGEGMATHYDSVDGGNCSFPGPPADHLDVALSEVEYGMADGCGAYLDVTGPNGTVRVKVTNRCPECQVGHLDLSRTAFARIAPLSAGQVDVSYSIVRNPPVDPLTMRVKQGSSRWWLQIQVDNHGNPLAGVELQTSSGWRSLPRSQDNFWTAENPGPGDGPFTFRITDVHGQSATVSGIELAIGVVQD
ncbi:MAG TPA: expansin EXLX1 family cellulose-binding protein, partial [Acidimicrobiales bacterium]